MLLWRWTGRRLETGEELPQLITKSVYEYTIHFIDICNIVLLVCMYNHIIYHIISYYVFKQTDT